MRNHNLDRPQASRGRRSQILFGVTAAIIAAGATAAPEALACGGFFCSATLPVNQAAERIIFADNGDGTITSLIQIMYEGPSENFAWVLPIPGNPEIGLSSTQAFDRLQAASNPVYRLNTVFDTEGCDVQGSGGSTGGFNGNEASGGSGGGGPLVTVLQSGSVGPLEFDVIEVSIDDEDPADVALEWLSDNDYDVTATTPEVLRPYLANGLNLVAFRLQKGKDAGSLRPVSLTYEAARAAIPILPTAVAANDDMGVMVWVLGKSRAVPTNYMGLELNERLIDWFTSASNYNAVVSAAADEAEGHGFVTEQAGPAAAFSTIIRSQSDVDVWAQIEDETDLYATLDRAANYFGSFDGFSDAAESTLTLREGILLEDFIACVSCYFNGFSSSESYADAGYPALVRADQQETAEEGGTLISQNDPIYESDMDAFREALKKEVIDPLWETAALFEDSDYVTRLYTTMSASEMTVDPAFDFNPDLEDLSNVHVLDRVLNSCNGEWVVTFEDGTTMEGSGGWPYSLDDINERFPAAARVIQYTTEGPGTVLLDKQAEIAMVVEAGMGGAMNGSGAASGMGDSSGGGETKGTEDTGGNGATSGGDSEPNIDSSSGGLTASSGDGVSRSEDKSGCSLSPGQSQGGSWGLFGVVLLGGLLQRRKRRSLG